MNIKLPKPYLSYSQLKLWLDNKEAYRDRYYRGITSPGSKNMLFGSEVAKSLEDGTANIPSLIQYPVKEYECTIEIDGVLFLGYLDQFWPERLKFREIKTGVKKSDGADRWDQRTVNNHLQLPIYSLLVQLKHGSVDDECHLDWLEVRRKTKKIMFNGQELSSISNDLELTGRIESFRRVVTQKERDMVRALIVSVANEISADYTIFLAAQTPFDSQELLLNAPRT